MKCEDRGQWGDVVQRSHINRMQEQVMQTERASKGVFAIKTTSRRTLGGNPRTNSISPRSGGSLPTHMCSIHGKSKSIKSKGSSLPALHSKLITLPQPRPHCSSAGLGRVNINTTPFAQHLFWRMHWVYKAHTNRSPSSFPPKHTHSAAAQ